MLLVLLSCAWILGLWLGSCFSPPLAVAAFSVMPLVAALFYRARRRLCLILAACLLVFFLAASYYPSAQPVLRPLAAYTGLTVEVRGTVVAPPEVRDNITHLRLNVEEINQKTAGGTVLLFVHSCPEYRYGNRLLVHGRLTDPPVFDDFDYQAYLAGQSIYSVFFNPEVQVLDYDGGSPVLRWVYSIRDRLSTALAAALPEPQAAFAQGIVLGIRSSIPADLKADLSSTGTAHLLAISGINLSIIAGMLVSLGLWLWGRRYSLYIWLALGVVWFYALLTGWQAPVVRAAIMATVFLAADLLGRQKNAFAALALSAAVMLGITPRLLFDISF
jgi:competence protein ComEC